MALITRLSSPSGDEPPACQLCAWLCGGEGEDRAHSWVLIGTDFGTDMGTRGCGSWGREPSEVAEEHHTSPTAPRLSTRGACCPDSLT